MDEAQDLHAAHWKLLRALVAEQNDDLFIVGDAHQRIYDNRTSLSAHGINVRGRSKRLTLNYRTTRQILTASLALLNGEEFDDLDGQHEELRGYRSVLAGAAPEVIGYATQSEELAALWNECEGGSRRASHRTRRLWWRAPTPRQMLHPRRCRTPDLPQ